MLSKQRILELAQKQEEYAIKTRRYLHENPELSGLEVNTAAFIQKEAESLGLEVEKLVGNSLIVTLDTGRKGANVALRADIDALPIVENPLNGGGKEKPCVSKNAGICHACGHDGHTAMLLGTMRALCEARSELCGRYYFCFEEGEESFYGYVAITEALKQKPVNTVFGIHLYADMPAGKISAAPGACMAGIYHIDFTLRGRGGHGSRPDLSINPVFAGASVLTNLACAFANRIDPFKPVTLGITTLIGGGVSNIIPETANIQGTFRFFDDDAGRNAYDIACDIAEHTAAMNLCTLEHGKECGQYNVATVNDEDASDLAYSAFNSVFEPETVVVNPPWFGSETFGVYLQQHKGAFAFLGIKNEETGCTAAHHNERFDIDESVLKTGIAAEIAYAVNAAESEAVMSWGPKRQ